MANGVRGEGFDSWIGSARAAFDENTIIADILARSREPSAPFVPGIGPRQAPYLSSSPPHTAAFGMSVVINSSNSLEAVGAVVDGWTGASVSLGSNAAFEDVSLVGAVGGRDTLEADGETIRTNVSFEAPGFSVGGVGLLGKVCPGDNGNGP